MPTQKITREMIVEAAFELAREQGMEAVQVKAVAAALGCSVQPVYGYCGSMEGLKELVTERAGRELREYVEARLDPADRFASLGRAYAAFAKEEPHLYRLWFLRPRPQAASLGAIFEAEGDPAVPGLLAQQLGISREKATALYFQMMIFNAGISFMLTALGENTDAAEVQRLQNSALAAFSAAARQEERE